jgi:hypothetical protein
MRCTVFFRPAAGLGQSGGQWASIARQLGAVQQVNTWANCGQSRPFFEPREIGYHRNSKRGGYPMRSLGLVITAASVMLVGALSSGAAQIAATADTGFSAIEAQQNAANSKPGPRTVPGRVIPVPRTASPELQAAIAAPYRVPAWNATPKNATEWKALITMLADAGASARREAREKLGVTLEATVIGGVNAFILTPKQISPENRNRLLIHVHGGAYVYNPETGFLSI